MHKIKLIIALFMLTMSTSYSQTWDCVVLQDSTNGFFDIIPPYECGVSKDYAPIPKYASHTPIKNIRVVLHIIQDANGNGNFDDIDIEDQNHNGQSEYWVKMINDLNNRYSNLKKETRQDPNHPTPIMKDGRIRFILTQNNIFYHHDNNFSNYGTSGWDSRLGNVYPKFVTNNTSMVHKDDALHVFAFPNIVGSGTNWAHFNSNRMALNGTYEDYINHGANSWYMRSSSLAHEIAHCLGLHHTNMTGGGTCHSSWDDGCDDTPPSGPLNPCGCPSPPNPDPDCGCWDGLASDHGHTGDNDSCSTNLMTYNNKANALTREQVGRIHFYLMHKNPNNYWINDYCTYDPNETITIASGTSFVWENTRYLKGDLVIESGATLTLKCYLSLPSGAEIKVKPGGKLIIDGGVVGNVCDETFAGIRVYGNTNLNQDDVNQGVVIMKNNATIENAVVGLSFIGKKANGDLDWNSRGGYVKATNAFFINNRKDVEFMSYHPKGTNGQEQFNRSFFKNCTFKTTDEIQFTSTPNEHVTMWDVNGVRFIGCSFKEERTGMQPANARVGIYTINASFTVEERCLNAPNCTNIDATEFIGLQQGVMSFGNGSKGLIRIENSQIKCYKGVYLNGTFESQVRGNNFDIKHISVLGGSTNYPYGLYLDVCNQFNTEGNDFKGLGNTSLEGAAGLVIRNAGISPNQFYRSQFEDLRVGSQALGLNRDDLFNGLTFKCNDYEDGFNDLDVRHEDMVWYLNAGMAEKQGIAGSWYPDNEFGNTSPILNLNAENTVNRIEYIYDGLDLQSNTYYPYQVTTSTFYRLRYDHSKPCPNKIGTYGISFGPLVTGMLNVELLLVNKKEDEGELTDGGNTDHFLTIIDGATSTNKNTVFNELNAASPYLSNRVLAELAQKESPFTQEQIRDLLLANPHASRNTYVMELLNNRNDNFPSAYITSIEGEVETYTHRDTLLTELAALEYEYNAYLTEYLAGKIADSTTTVGQLHSYMKHPTQPAYHYHLADMYFTKGKYAQFNQVKDSIPMLFTLDERQQEFHTSYGQLHLVMQNWYMADSVLHRADTGRYNYLQSFETNYDVMPPAFYSMMAVNNDFVLDHNVYIPETGTEPFDESTYVAEILKAENESSVLNLFPNPAKDAVTLEWKAEFEQAQVTVYDATGRLIWQHNWKQNSSLNINTSAWESGNYLIRLQTQSGKMHQRKLLINK